MARARQTIANEKDGPVYISIEPWPECFELEPGDRLTLVYDVPAEGDALLVSFLNERELVIWPQGSTDGLEILFNGEPADGRSWVFRHQ